MDKTITIEIHGNHLNIGEENSSGVSYTFSDDDCVLDDIVKAVSDYIYTYCSDADDNV